MILRDYWFCWVSFPIYNIISHFDTRLIIYSNDQILSIAFELAEYSLQHQLANFAEVRYSCVFLR